MKEFKISNSNFRKLVGMVDRYFTYKEKRVANGVTTTVERWDSDGRYTKNIYHWSHGQMITFVGDSGKYEIIMSNEGSSTYLRVKNKKEKMDMGEFWGMEYNCARNFHDVKMFKKLIKIIG